MTIARTYPATPTASGGLGRIATRHIMAIWFGLAVVVLVLFARGAAVLYDQILTPCAGPACLPWQREDLSNVSARTYAIWQVTRETILALTFAAIGGLVLVKARQDAFARFGAFTFLLFGVCTLTDATEALVRTSLATRVVAGTLQACGALLMIWFLFTFPNGQFVPRWTQWLVAAMAPVQAATYLSSPGFLLNHNRGVDLPLTLLILMLAVGCQVIRFRKVDTPLERQQGKWVILGFGVAVAGLAVVAVGFPMIGPDIIANRRLFAMIGMAMASAFLMLIPISVALAMLRYRLWDVDRLMNRALVYLIVSGSTVLVYAATVAITSAVLVSGGRAIGAILGAAAVAVLFGPMHQLVQRRVNRLFYGDRDAPDRVLTELSARLDAAIEPDAMLDTIVRSIRESLRIPYASIRSTDGTVLAADGSRRPAASWPLASQGTVVGWLDVAPRGDEELSASDRTLIGAIAAQAGLAVRSRVAARELADAHERLQTLRVDERDRLRRDLHDGLGPLLAGQTLTLDAAIATLPQDADGALDLLQHVRRHTDQASGEIRRVIDELRPSALDRGSLVETLDASLDGYRSASTRINVQVGAIPGLPPGVEVALYRITHEAITNVVRHAAARSVDVTLAWDEPSRSVVLTITDDGRGIPGSVNRGVGLESMEQRAARLGGTLRIAPNNPSGTVVRVSIPVDDAP